MNRTQRVDVTRDFVVEGRNTRSGKVARRTSFIIAIVQRPRDLSDGGYFVMKLFLEGNTALARATRGQPVVSIVMTVRSQDRGRPGRRLAILNGFHSMFARVGFHRHLKSATSSERLLLNGLGHSALCRLLRYMVRVKAISREDEVVGSAVPGANAVGADTVKLLSYYQRIGFDRPARLDLIRAGTIGAREQDADRIATATDIKQLSEELHYLPFGGYVSTIIKRCSAAKHAIGKLKVTIV